MPIQDGKYVTPAWQNGGPPAITAEELKAIGESIEQNESDIQTANNNIQQNAQDIDSLQTWQSTVNGQISSIQSGYLQKTGGTMTGILNMGNQRITNLATPSSGTDAVNKNYVDKKTNYKLRSSTTATMSNLNFILTVNPSTVLPNQLFICFNVTNLVRNNATELRLYDTPSTYFPIALNGNNSIYRTCLASYTNIGSTGGQLYIDNITDVGSVYSFTVDGDKISGKFSFYNGVPEAAVIRVYLYELR